MMLLEDGLEFSKSNYAGAFETDSCDDADCSPMHSSLEQSPIKTLSSVISTTRELLDEAGERLDRILKKQKTGQAPLLNDSK